MQHVAFVVPQSSSSNSLGSSVSLALRGLGALAQSTVTTDVCLQIKNALSFY